MKASWRQKLQVFFNGESVVLKIWELCIDALIFTSIIQLLGEYNIFQLGLTGAQNTLLDIAIASIFAIDYALRLYASEARKKYVLDIFNIINLAAIIPSFIGIGEAKSLRSLRVLRTLRALRFLRILKLIKALEIVDHYERVNPIKDELAFYNKLLAFYEKLIVNMSEKFHQHKSEELLQQVENIQAATNIKIINASKNGLANEAETFTLTFYELTQQTRAILQKIKQEQTELSIAKLAYTLRELGLLLQSQNTHETIKILPSKSPNIHIQFLRLIRLSIRDILTTFSVAVAINIVIVLSPLKAVFASAIEYLAIIEAAMGALIVFITSFNMSYTNSKRGETDLSIISFLNSLVIYTEKIRTLVDEGENSVDTRTALYKKINYYFDCIGLDILNGVRHGNPYHLRFDHAIMESFDRIRVLILPYLQKLDSTARGNVEIVQTTLIDQLNTFQTKSTIRTAVVFNSLNHWVIRITYFVLTALSPLSALPRLFIISLMQRAFFETANETDNAIFNISLATLPVEDRVLRRLCRINSVLLRLP